MATDSVCKVEGCCKPVFQSRLCDAHWSRWKRHGDPLGGGPTKGFAQAKVAEFIASQTDECMIWPYSRLAAGYGKVGRDLVHRLVCEAVHGKPPSPDYYAAHTCHTPACGNHRHLYWATPAQNQADRVKDGTSNRGRRQWQAQLDEEKVREIRRRVAAGATHASVADAFGVTRIVVTKVVNRHTWAWVE